jgi:ribosomal protein S18 acetylase RimI-like enzyme
MDSSASIAFRPIENADQGFLYRLYASTRQEELSVLDWTEAQKRDFLRTQFRAQHTYYMAQFASARFDLILLDGEPIGRLYLDRRKDEHRIIDIALLPEFRNRGIGGGLLRDILAEAQSAGLPVRIHVEQFNPALRLYRRMGFSETGENGPYYLMEWQPQPPAAR